MGIHADGEVVPLGKDLHAQEIGALAPGIEIKGAARGIIQGFLGIVESLEDPFPDLGGEADAVVGDGKDDLPGGLLQPDFNGAAVGGVFHGVAEKTGEGFFQGDPGHEDGRSLGQVGGNVEVTALEFRGQGFQQLPGEFMEADGGGRRILQMECGVDFFFDSVEEFRVLIGLGQKALDDVLALVEDQGKDRGVEVFLFLDDVVDLIFNAHDAAEIPLDAIQDGAPVLVGAAFQFPGEDFYGGKEDGRGGLQLVGEMGEHFVLGRVQGLEFLVGPVQRLGNPGIFNGKGHGAGQGVEDVQVGLVEFSLLFIVRRDDADGPLLGFQGDHHEVFDLVPDFFVALAVEIVVLGHGVHDQGLSGLDHLPGHQVVHGEADAADAVPGAGVVVGGGEEIEFIPVPAQQEDIRPFGAQHAFDFRAHVVGQGAQPGVFGQGLGDAIHGFFIALVAQFHGHVPVDQDHARGAAGFILVHPHPDDHVPVVSGFGQPPGGQFDDGFIGGQGPDHGGEFIGQIRGNMVVAHLAPDFVDGPAKGLGKGRVHVGDAMVAVPDEDGVGQKAQETAMVFPCPLPGFQIVVPAGQFVLQGLDALEQFFSAGLGQGRLLGFR